MTFITWIMLGCILMVINLKDGKFEKVSKEKYPEFEKKLLDEGIQPPSYETFYKVSLGIVITIYALFWPAIIANMLVKLASGEKKK